MARTMKTVQETRMIKVEVLSMPELSFVTGLAEISIFDSWLSPCVSTWDPGSMTMVSCVFSVVYVVWLVLDESVTLPLPSSSAISSSLFNYSSNSYILYCSNSFYRSSSSCLSTIVWYMTKFPSSSCMQSNVITLRLSMLPSSFKRAENPTSF